MAKDIDTGELLSGCGQEVPQPDKADVDGLTKEVNGIPLDTKISDLTLGEMMAALSIGNVPASSEDNTKEEDKLLFNFDNITKKEIYSHLLAIIKIQGFRSSNAQVIRFLAKHTNLGSEKSIHALLYEYQKAVY